MIRMLLQHFPPDRKSPPSLGRSRRRVLRFIWKPPGRRMRRVSARAPFRPAWGSHAQSELDPNGPGPHHVPDHQTARQTSNIVRRRGAHRSDGRRQRPRPEKLSLSVARRRGGRDRPARRLSRPPAAGPGRHGLCLSSGRRLPAPAGGPQGHETRSGAGRRLGAVSPRGPPDGFHQARPRRHGIPGGPGGASPVPGHGIAARQVARRLDETGAENRRDGGGPAGPTNRRRAGGHPRQRPHSPRPQAGQHLAGGAQGAGQNPRFRAGPLHRGRRASDPDGNDRRHAVVHVAGTGAGRNARRRAATCSAWVASCTSCVAAPARSRRRPPWPC